MHPSFAEASQPTGNYAQTIGQLAQDRLVGITVNVVPGDTFDINIPDPSTEASLPFRIIAEDGGDTTTIASIHTGNSHDITSHSGTEDRIVKASGTYVVYRHGDDPNLRVQQITLEELNSGVAFAGPQSAEIATLDDAPRGTKVPDNAMNLSLSHIPSQDRIFVRTAMSPTADTVRFAPYVQTVAAMPQPQQ